MMRNLEKKTIPGSITKKCSGDRGRGGTRERTDGRGRMMGGRPPNAHCSSSPAELTLFLRERKVNVCKRVTGHWYSNTMLIIIMDILRDQAKMQY